MESNNYNQQEQRLLSDSDSEPFTSAKKQRLEEPEDADGDVEMTTTSTSTSTSPSTTTTATATMAAATSSSATQSIDAPTATATTANSIQSQFPNIRVINPPRTDGPSSYLSPSTSSQPSSFSSASGAASPVPTAAELKSAFAGTLAGRNGPNAPLMTRAMREKEDIRLGRVKKEWNVVKIRFRFSDRTQLETQFPTTSNLSTLYSFLPTTLTSEHSKSKFTLYQTPPRKDLLPNDPKLKDKNLGELGMTPQAVIYVRWKDEGLNGTTSRPPLKEELWKVAEECEPPKGLDERGNNNNMENLGSGRTLAESSGETKKEGENEGKDRKAMPKWLMKGFKK